MREREKERERARERWREYDLGRDRERRKEEISSRLHVVSTEPDARLKLTNREIGT